MLEDGAFGKNLLHGGPNYLLALINHLLIVVLYEFVVAKVNRLLR